MATSKSWLMPIDSSRNRSAGTPASTSPSRSARSRRNQGRASSGFSASGGSSISPTSRAAVQPRGGLDDRRHLVDRRAVFRVLQRQIHLDQHVDGAPGFAGGLIDPLQQVDAVDRVNRADRRRGFPRLVRLQVADEVPPQSAYRSTVQFSAGLPGPCSRRSRCCPASAAARTASMGWVLETAISRTSSGLRPARPAAFAMRSRISASRSGMCSYRLGPGTGWDRKPVARKPKPSLLLQLRDHPLRLRRRTGRRARASGRSRIPRPLRRACLR